LWDLFPFDIQVRARVTHLQGRPWTHKNSLHETLTTVTFGSAWARAPVPLSSKF
jgi:hypothetical protein